MRLVNLHASDTILILDLGTSSLKVTLFDTGAQRLARAAAGFPTYHDTPLAAEQSPSGWWDATCEAIQKLSEQYSLEHVVAVGVTGQMHAVVPVSDTREALGPALTLRDRRAVSESKRLETELGLETIYRITGARLDPSTPLPKIAWLKNNRPDIVDNAAWFLAAKDFLRLKLTDEVATDPIDAAGMLLYDVRRATWSAELCAAIGLSTEDLPPIRKPTAIAGHLTPDAASALGLSDGIPVIVGAGDDIEFLGVNLTTPGATLEHLGTTGSILSCVENPVLDAKMRVELYPHVDPDLWLLGGSTSNAGGALQWAYRILSESVVADGRLTFPEDAPQDGLPLLVFVPHLSGERSPVWNPFARGVIHGLSLEHSRDDLIRAIYQGVGLSLRHVLDTIVEIAGPVHTIIETAGGEDALAWRQMRADIYGRPLVVPASDDATALGTFILTAVALGVYDTIEAGSEAVVKHVSRVEPRTNRQAYYARLNRYYHQVLKSAQLLFDPDQAVERQAGHD